MEEEEFHPADGVYNSYNEDEIATSVGQVMALMGGQEELGDKADELLAPYGTDGFEYAGNALYESEDWATELLEDYRTSPEVVAFQLMGGQTAETRSRTSETAEIENQREKIKTGEIFL